MTTSALPDGSHFNVDDFSKHQSKIFHFPTPSPMHNISVWTYPQGRLVISFFAKDLRTSAMLQKLPLMKSDPDEPSTLTRISINTKEKDTLLPPVFEQMQRQATASDLFPIPAQIIDDITRSLSILSEKQTYDCLKAKTDDLFEGKQHCVKDKDIQALFIQAKEDCQKGHDRALLVLGRCLLTHGQPDWALLAFEQVNDSAVEVFQEAKFEQASLLYSRCKTQEDKKSVFEVLAMAGEGDADIIKLRSHIFQQLCGYPGLKRAFGDTNISTNTETLCFLADHIEQLSKKIKTLEHQSMDNAVQSEVRAPAEK